MYEKAKLSLSFGALSPSLAEQLTDAGFRFDVKRLNYYQSDADALTRLSVRGLITEASVQRGRRNLLKAIAQEVTKETP